MHSRPSYRRLPTIWLPASTAGFKKSRAVFEDLLYQNVRQVGAQSSADTQLPSGLMLGLGVRTVATEKLFNQGNLVETGNAFDMAIEGRGFFEVLMPDGSQAFTRDGSFQVDAQGQLVTSSVSLCSPRLRFPRVPSLFRLLVMVSVAIPGHPSQHRSATSGYRFHKSGRASAAG